MDEDWLAKESDTDSGCCRNVSSIASLALVLGGVNSDVSAVSTHLRLPKVDEYFHWHTFFCAAINVNGWQHIECMPYLIT